MAACQQLDDSWQVVVGDNDGRIVGAGVLLSDRLVLTCAHVVKDSGGARTSGLDKDSPGVRVRSVLCNPPWSTPARVLPDGWVSEHDTQRGDLALLGLAEPVTCHQGTRLRRLPARALRGVAVHARGFPHQDKAGVSAEGRLAGHTRDADWVEIHARADDRAPWVTRGFSGAGVADDASGDVIGIIMAVREDGPLAAAYMMPVETIIGYLPRLGEFSRGGTTSDPGFSWPAQPPPDAVTVDAAAVDVALRQEIGRLFTGVWTGTAVVTGGDPESVAPWLARLVASADPAARRTIPDAAFARSSPGTVLGVGAIDLAVDAYGHDTEWIRRRISERFRLPGSGCAGVVDGLLRYEPPPTLVIDRVDGATDAARLVAELLAPLAARARRRGLRLVLGFAGEPPAGLRHEVSLGPEPVAGTARGPDRPDRVRRAIAELADAERELAIWHARVSVRVAGVPAPPPGIAARLRVRFAVAVAVAAAGDGTATAELALIGGRAREALAQLARHDARLRELERERHKLGRTLEAYRERAGGLFGPEDRQLGELYGQARQQLMAKPCDLGAVRVAVNEYVVTVRKREAGQR